MTLGMICFVAFLGYHVLGSVTKKNDPLGEKKVRLRSSPLPLWKNTNKVTEEHEQGHDAKPPTYAKMKFINQLTALHSAPDFWEQAHNMLRATRTCCEKGRAANIA